MSSNLCYGLAAMAIFVIQLAVSADENIFNRVRRQIPDYHPENSLSREPYSSENVTNPDRREDENRGFFFQFDVPYGGRNVFGADMEDGKWKFFWQWKQHDPSRHFGHPRMNFQIEDLGNTFEEKCCRFENRFLKDLPMSTEEQLDYPNVNKVFLFDISPQMSHEEWAHIQEGLMLMVDNMCLRTEHFEETDEESDGQMVTFMTTDGQVKHYHKESLEVDKIKQDIVHLQGYKRISCTNTLLQKAYTYIDKYSDKSKSYTKHEVLLITDGQSTCHLPFFTEARRLRSVAHVSVVTITKDGGPHGEIRVTDIATDSSTDNIYSFHSCRHFLDMMKHINGRPCRRCPRLEEY